MPPLSLKTVRELVVGKSTVRLLKTTEGYEGAVIGPKGVGAQLSGDDPDALWTRLLAEVGKAHPSYFGFDGARARFLSFFPEGFADPDYIAKERVYKDEAVAKIGGLLPLQAAAAARPADGAAAVKAYQATNLVFQVEKARIKDVLTGPAGPAFLAAAARFAAAEVDSGDIAAGLSEMIAAVRASGNAPSWPMLTYLPFMWRPDRHLFLKPAVTCDFAARVGHRFARDYAGGLTASVYESLLDMAEQTRRETAPLAPRDLIDVQSFIWVVGGYPDAHRDPSNAV